MDGFSRGASCPSLAVGDWPSAECAPRYALPSPPRQVGVGGGWMDLGLDARRARACVQPPGSKL